MSGIVIHTLFVLLDDAFTPVDLGDLNRRANQALSQLLSIESLHLVPHLVGASVAEALLIEKAASILNSHGIPLRASGTFNASSSLSSACGVVASPVENEYFIDGKQMANHMLNGLTVNVRYDDSKLQKEKVLWVSPTLTRLCWETRRTNRVRFIPVQSIDVGRGFKFEG